MRETREIFNSFPTHECIWILSFVNQPRGFEILVFDMYDS